MNTIAAIPRPAPFGLAIALACGLTATASADDWASPEPRLFTSEYGRYGFKVLPKNTAGVLFSMDGDGKEQVIWNKPLVSIPDQVFVAEDGKHVVTVDTYADLGREHSLVVYDAKGKVLGDYRLEELLSEQEIRDRVVETSPNRWWASEASFKFRDRGQQTKYFEIALKWGKLITVNLDTGKLEIEGPAEGDEGQRPTEPADAGKKVSGTLGLSERAYDPIEPSKAVLTVTPPPSPITRGRSNVGCI